MNLKPPPLPEPPKDFLIRLFLAMISLGILIIALYVSITAVIGFKESYFREAKTARIFREARTKTLDAMEARIRALHPPPLPPPSYQTTPPPQKRQ